VINRTVKTLIAAVGFLVFASTAFADGSQVVVRKSSKSLVEKYVPGIWVDPDGCEHWVMDDGVEGYMTPHVTRDGIPVCRRGNPCAIMNSDQLFNTDRFNITASGRRYLLDFFAKANATSFIIDGHTDSDASDEYNMRLSERRAKAVASVAAQAGKRAQVRWYGERVPVASNSTRAGKAKNRRVEITCVR
jgi:outer membrane protein OmpA-like peptidoglycan-associated protein